MSTCKGDVVTSLGADEALAEMGAVLTLETHPKLTHQRIEQVVETVAIIAISEAGLKRCEARGPAVTPTGCGSSE